MYADEGVGLEHEKSLVSDEETKQSRSQFGHGGPELDVLDVEMCFEVELYVHLEVEFQLHTITLL